MVSTTSCGNAMQPSVTYTGLEIPAPSPLFDDSDAVGAAVVKSSLQGGFTPMPNDILTCRQISARAKLAYQGLLYYVRQKDTCSPGHAQLAAVVGCSEDTVQRGLKDLR